jgi:Cell morphogenesis central region
VHQSWPFHNLKTPSPDFPNPQTLNRAVLQGPAFDVDARRPQGKPVAWIERLFLAKPAAAPADAGRATARPSKDAVARSALLNLLQSNLDLLDACVDQCYSPHAVVSRGYFQVPGCVTTCDG